MSEQGWIKLHRQIREHAFFKQKRKFSKFEAWVDILLSVNHKEEKMLVDYNTVVVKRGEMITSEVKLAERWRWDRKTVRKYLTMLVKEKMILKNSTARWTSITVLNWDKYQSDGQEPGQDIGQVMGMDTTRWTGKTVLNWDKYQSDGQVNGQGVGQAMDRGLDTNKNDKNDKNDIYKDTTTITTIDSTVQGTSEKNDSNRSRSCNVFKFYEENIGLLSPLIAEKITNWANDTEEALVELAIEKAVTNNKRNFSYIEGILRNWATQGIRTRKDAEIAEKEFQQQKEQKRQPPPGAKKHPDDRPLTPEEKKRLEELNIELSKIGKELNFL